MNILEKCYCRIFQKVMYLAIPVMPYREPRIIDGMAQLVRMLKKNHRSRVLLVTDQGIRSLGLTGELERMLAQAGIRCVVYDGTSANPTTVNARDAAAMYRKADCSAIIAFGGGSAMDCAKAAGALVVRPKKALSQMKGILKVHKRLPVLIAIPTTAGTGSETTVCAVITDAQTRDKYAINDFCLIPSHAVMAPELTLGLPKILTATTGMDALTHAVEAYIGRSATRDTKRQAIEAVELIFDNLLPAYDDGNNLEVRGKMLRASYLAGLAFTKSYIGYVHALAHSLGGKYGTPHGLANAVLLPVLLDGYGKSAYRKLAQLAKAVGVASIEEDHKTAAEKFIAKIKSMNAYMGIPDKLDDIRREDIPELAAHAAKEANPLYPVPKLMDAGELNQFYVHVMK